MSQAKQVKAPKGQGISDAGVSRVSHAKQTGQFPNARKFKILISASAKIKDVHRDASLNCATLASDRRCNDPRQKRLPQESLRRSLH